MKVICPQHGDSIEVSDLLIMNAGQTSSRSLVIHCPICDDDILIENIRVDLQQVQDLPQYLKWPETEISTLRKGDAQ